MDASYKAKGHYQDPAVAALYDRERFSTWHGRLAHRAEQAALEDVIHRRFVRGESVLDLPCGTGRLLNVYRSLGLRVVGGDISEAMLEVARRRFDGDALYSFEVCDAEKLPFPDASFDCLVSFRLMCHLPADVRRRVLGEMARVSRRLLVVNYHFDVHSPLMLFNRIFRPATTALPYPLRRSALREEMAGLELAVVEIRPLSWYERSSCLVVMQKG